MLRVGSDPLGPCVLHIPTVKLLRDVKISTYEQKSQQTGLTRDQTQILYCDHQVLMTVI